MIAANENTAPRRLDHFVLPVASLETARARLTALGFTVAPEARHPFGTVNACVFLADDTYFEPLAIGDAQAVETAIEEGSPFLTRDRVYRERFGADGFSAVVVKSSDAAADHARFVEKGVSAGPPFEFSRPFENPAGQSDVATFRLAYAADRDDPATFVFACERANMPAVDRTDLESHANGATGIARIVAVADDPAACGKLLGTLTCSRPAGDTGLTVPTAGASIDVLTPVQAEAIGISKPRSARMTFAAIVCRVVDVEKTASVLSAGGVDHVRHDGTIVVRPAAGQGATFIFEE